jgi:hypothetical protein
MNRGLGAVTPLPLSVSVPPVQRVGETAIYRISGAPPGSVIYWTSYKDGAHTGELRDTYGDTIAPNGTAEVTAGSAWTEDNIGEWIKEFEVVDGDGKHYLGVVHFQVIPAAATGSGGGFVPSSSFLDDELFALGSFSVTGKTALLIVGAYFLYNQFGGARRR